MTDPQLDDVIRQIAELPDRTSPDDWPEAMLVTAEELRRILQPLLIAQAAQVETLQNDGPPGQWVCRTCGFVLMKMQLRASDMAVGIDARPVEDICPNDGSSMRPLTWKEDAENSDRVGREQMKRADDLEALVVAQAAQLETVQQEHETLKKEHEELLARVDRQPDTTAALPQPPIGDTWRPIETAPKDGTRVLLVAPAWRELRVGRWREHAFNGVVKQWWQADVYEVSPTHWMPLPSPPTQETGEPQT